MSATNSHTAKLTKRDIAFALDWLRAALDYKDWHWDGDQWNAANESYYRAKRVLRLLRKQK